MFLKYKKTKGFSLVEMLVYAALLSFFMVISVNAGIIMTGAYARARTSRLLDNNAQAILLKIGGEVRKSSEISPSSSLGVSPGHLILTQTTDSGSSSAEFYVSGGVLLLKRDGVVVGSITTPGSVIESLIFYKIGTAEKQAVRTAVRIRVSGGGEDKVENFYMTTVLRGSYEE